MTKEVVAFNDISSFGRCSLSVALPILSTLGIQCHPVPTMVLTGQCGYPISYKKDMTSMLPQYTCAWNAIDASFDGIYTGYMTCPEQIDHVLDFIDAFKKEDTFLLVDPVMGDNGGTYRIYSKKLLARMRKLTHKATLITPNLTEACLLAGTSYDKITDITNKHILIHSLSTLAKSLADKAEGKQDVIITGIHFKEGDESKMMTFAWTEGTHYTYVSPWYHKHFSGTGDILSSTMCGLLLNGYSIEEALPIAGDFIHNSIVDTIPLDTDGNDGIHFEKHLCELVKHAK